MLAHGACGGMYNPLALVSTIVVLEGLIVGGWVGLQAVLRLNIEFALLAQPN